jgi:Ca2+-binding RTX toxin-like protein
LAFTTIPGASATDVVTFEGTDGADILATFSTLTGLVESKAGNDSVTLSNGAVGLVDWTIRGADGTDTITTDSDLRGGLLNGNADRDFIITSGVLNGARVLGGQGNDDINVDGVVSNASVNGNKGNDVMNINGAMSNASIFGGQGVDNIDVFVNDAGEAFVNSIIDQNLGGGTINITVGAGNILTDVAVFGGESVDVIDASTVASSAVTDGLAATAVEGLAIDGKEGGDNLKGSQRDDTIDGGDGDDIISGGAGADELTGGGGKTTYTFANGLDTWVGSIDDANKVTAAAADLIVDFKVADAAGAIDMIDIGSITTLTSTGTSYADINTAINSSAVAFGDVELVAIGSNGSYKAFLLINSIATAGAGGAGVDGAIQLGNTTYSTVEEATNIVGTQAVITQANIFVPA